ncbi:unnamed protein product [Adineta steineri]|uniref:Uncharacterized protein n=1 Tax=Adineta steineri TaxID=433720 RepID=A0A820HLF7_9BILA|nr:unnamed protein product [Adineta steineri]
MEPKELVRFTPYESDIQEYARQGFFFYLIQLKLGGHGRTGTIMSILIGILFNLEADDAINYNYQLKRQRLRVKGKTSSLHSRQCEQVQIVLRIYQDQQESLSEQEILE